jgi:hypothetical protein
MLGFIEIELFLTHESHSFANEFVSGGWLRGERKLLDCFLTRSAAIGNLGSPAFSAAADKIRGPKSPI